MRTWRLVARLVACRRIRTGQLLRRDLELQALRLPLGLAIERNLFFASTVSISIWAKAARETHSIRAAERLLGRCA
ncbi:MAG: DUF2958 domain-containing protein, partial [Paracoccus sp. (in: a-proteobacteria)]